MTTKIKEYTIEVLYLGEPRFVVDIQELSEEDACRRAKTAVWMQQLRADDPWDKNLMEARVYEPGRVPE